jgi:hypothetical protein
VDSSFKSVMNYLDTNMTDFEVMSWPFLFSVCAPTLCDAQEAVAAEHRKAKIEWFKKPTEDFMSAVKAAVCDRVSVQSEAPVLAPGPAAVRCPPQPKAMSRRPCHCLVCRHFSWST